MPHFRGCSGELNRAPRAYHSGDFEEIGWILQRLRRAPRRAAAGRRVSLGGNALLRWAGEAGDDARERRGGGRDLRRRWTWPPPARPSTAASTGWSIRACSWPR
jgi:hypothetical protein